MEYSGKKKKIFITISVWILVIASVMVFFWHKKSFSKDSDEYKIITDVPYTEMPGFDKKLTSLDLYVPKKGNNFPVMVFIHGGAWRTGDKSNHNKKAVRFAEEGFIFVSVNYRLSPQVTFPVYVQDVAKAAGWIYKHISTYGGNSEKIFLMGHSAGAHLASLVATDEKYVKEEGYNLDLFKGVVLLDGAGYDIPKIKKVNERLFNRIYKPAFGEDSDILKNASPMYHVAKDKGIPPFFIIYAGSREMSRVESMWLGDSLKEAGVYAELYHASDKNHGTVNKELGLDKDESTEKILQFLRKIMERDN